MHDSEGKVVGAVEADPLDEENVLEDDNVDIGEQRQETFGHEKGG